MTAWLPRDHAGKRLLIGLGVATLAVTVYSLLRAGSDPPWVLLSRIWRYGHLDEMTQVFLEDVTIAILFVRLAGAVGSRWATVVVACLFAAGHIPAMVSQGASWPELSTVREALRPLAEPSEPSRLGTALLAFLATDPDATVLALPDRLRILGHLRRDGLVPSSVVQPIKTFEDRWMLASAGVFDEPALAGEVDRWLAALHQAGYYRFSLNQADERAAFLGALSRKVDRDRRVAPPPGGGSQAWLVGSPSQAAPSVVLNEALWRIAVAEFSPLPLGSRIPYARVPRQATLVLDEATAMPMSAREAGDRLAGE